MPIEKPLRGGTDVVLVRDVRYGSLADITARSRHVRFIPHSGHSLVQVGCPKSAISRQISGAERATKLRAVQVPVTQRIASRITSRTAAGAVTMGV
jgi:hypothetical protein